ncbi:S1 family peptidase [Lampropedia puyangensis]|uniref:S1 family peptidase n=1 Tax=Lampropedia puyangensis TaxID=1330072 RepID=A0A4S8FCK6_9BURK|nr:trypsin-like peptidase domain-containing protein [Lampropedia puyangensis]THU05338.1 S1 family peptidase [Lampropedia puyangensis]
MQAYRFCFTAIAAATMLSACGGGSDNPPENEAPYVLNVKKVEGRYNTNKAATATDLKSLSAFNAANAVTISLPALDTQDLVLKSAAVGGAVQVAEAQAVPQAKTATQLAQLLSWQTDAQGQNTAALRVHATDAFGLRLGLVVDALPDSATVRVFKEANGQVEAVGYETTGAAINQTIKNNTDAGDTSIAGRTWWSADLGGDTVVLQINLPAGVPSEAVKVALPTISNMFRDASEYTYAVESADSASSSNPLQDLNFNPAITKAEQVPSAGSCNLDVTCYNNGSQQRDAVARMLFTQADGKGYWCTGSLLNDAINSNTPYFLTANHCISSQTEASSLQTDWFFRTSSCNGNYLDAKRTTRAGGARLLFSNNSEQGNDITLLVLNDAAPAGTFLAGWDANQNNTEQNIYGIHHPAGSLAKIAGGQTVAYANCNGDTCSSNPNGRFYWVQWAEGITEGGSSGSALFTANGYVIGALHGGSSECSAKGSPDFYGRLDMAFEAGAKNFLASSKVPF